MKIEYFEPGCIQCSTCGHKPEDPWDTDPEGFTELQSEWLCDDCLEVDKAERLQAAKDEHEMRSFKERKNGEL